MVNVIELSPRMNIIHGYSNERPAPAGPEHLAVANVSIVRRAGVSGLGPVREIENPSLIPPRCPKCGHQNLRAGACNLMPAAHNFDMGEAWKDRFLGEFQCAQCGALYEVALTRLSAAVYEEVICEVCRRVMNEWRGTVGRAYTLKSRSP
jgi:transcription elongation factor Elf1